ncbi:MAG: HNH endonuclease signature motif containing protein, partial [bacterium]
RKFDWKSSDYDWQLDYCKELHETISEKILSSITDETFTLLFGNRRFLLEFNLIISQIIKQLKKDEYPGLLHKDGVIHRCSYWPKWVGSGVFFRDRGRCAICQKDLTGLLVSGVEKALDHIVPLKLGGTNEIINLQLLCPVCNGKKGGTKILTSDNYPLYF